METEKGTAERFRIAHIEIQERYQQEINKGEQLQLELWKLKAKLYDLEHKEE
jgi:hypothetical protein